MATPKPLDCDEPASAPATMGSFLIAARRAGTLDELTAAYAALIARDGFGWHVLSERGAVGVTPLCGVGTPGPGGYEIAVRSWDGARRFVTLGGRAASVGRSLAARLAGTAELYATFGVAMLQRESDVATSVGLGLAERQCLAQLLLGHGEGEIAAKLGIDPLAVAEHVRTATRTLGVATRAEAIALAARRGWLASIFAAADEGRAAAPN